MFAGRGCPGLCIDLDVSEGAFLAVAIILHDVLENSRWVRLHFNILFDSPSMRQEIRPLQQIRSKHRSKDPLV